MRIAGYFALIGVMVLSNFIAVVRWPFASILKWISTNRETAKTSRDIREPVEAGPEYLPKMVEQHEYVLVDFWAAWCGPCIMMNRSLERLAADREFACLVAKVDTVAYPKLAEKYDVKGLPTLILYHNGDEVKRYAGALSYSELKEFIDV